MTLPLLAQAEPVETPEIVWSFLWPLIILSIGAILLVTITSLVPATRGRGFPAFYTALCGIAAIAFLPWMSSRLGGDDPDRVLVVAEALAIDNFTIFVTGVICMAVVLVALLLDDYLRREGLDGPEWYVLLLLSASGGVLLASAEDLIVTFLGLEVLSIAVYVLAALHLRRLESQEAGFKYFILGALSSAVFLYGIALVYGATGSTKLSSISANITAFNQQGLSPASESSLILVGMALMLVGFGFKVSAAPFHVWTPDVYEGSPTPIVGFMGSAVKVAGFAGLLRVFVVGFGGLSADWRTVLAGMAVITLLVGAFLAVVQKNVKRMLAYSSITHAGFMLIAVNVAGHPAGPVGDITRGIGAQGTEAALFYFFAYSLLVIGTFAVITVVGRRGDGDHSVDSYRGLASRQPFLAACFAILLFAQAGVPFTSGFFAKFRVLDAAARAELWVLMGVAMVAAAIAAYLYLRVVVAMFLTDDDPDREAAPIHVPPAVLVVVGLSAIVTIVLGVVPDLGQDILRDAGEALALAR